MPGCRNRQGVRLACRRSEQQGSLPDRILAEGGLGGDLNRSRCVEETKCTPRANLPAATPTVDANNAVISLIYEACSSVESSVPDAFDLFPSGGRWKICKRAAGTVQLMQLRGELSAAKGGPERRIAFPEGDQHNKARPLLPTRRHFAKQGISCSGFEKEALPRGGPAEFDFPACSRCSVHVSSSPLRFHPHRRPTAFRAALVCSGDRSPLRGNRDDDRSSRRASQAEPNLGR